MSIISIINLNTAADTLVSACLNGRFKCVGVVKVLHGLTAQVNAQLLQLTRLAVFKTKHVQNSNETISCMSHGLAQDCKAFT